MSREQIEIEVEQSLHSNGWLPGTAVVVVIEPELEAWVWADTPQVSDALGWENNRQQLRPFLEKEGLWDSDAPKPANPKEALDRALREQGKPRGAKLFADLAKTVGLGHCKDPAFVKLQSKLLEWFPA